MALARAVPLPTVVDGRTVEFKASSSIRDVRVEFSPEEWQQGTFRSSHLGKLRYFNENLKEEQEWDVVVKKFRLGKVFHADAWHPDLRSLDLAHSMAEAWGAAHGGSSGAARIDVDQAFLFRTCDSGEVVMVEIAIDRFPNKAGRDLKVFDPRTRQWLELPFEGPDVEASWTKWNSNSGWILEGRGDVMSKVAQAFSHFTWIQSGRQYIVTDIQGVVLGPGTQFVETRPHLCQGFPLEARLRLTDPAVHSWDVDRRSHCGLADLGRYGVYAFFHHHVCNDLCKHLAKPSMDMAPRDFLSYVQKQRHTVLQCLHPKLSSLVHNQGNSGTCYAFASATVLRAAEGRIIGREVVDHRALVKRIVEDEERIRGPNNGGCLSDILSRECSARGLRFERVDAAGASEALQHGRPVLMGFCLTNVQWAHLIAFFNNAKDGVLTSVPAPESRAREGHAVVIEKQEGDMWLIKNSWGETFDNGRFRVHKAALTDVEFFDVFWYESDLADADRAAFQRHIRAQQN